MLRSSILASTALALALALGPGTAGAAGDKPAKAAAGQSSSVPKQQRVTTDQYLEKAAAGDLFEVESGKLAAQKGASNDVKQFGRMMTQDHMASTDKIKQAAAKSPKAEAEPAKLTGHQQATMKRLMEAEGRQFDKLYVDAQMEAHREALELHRSYAATGDDPALKKAASEIAPVVEKHLAELRKISKTVTGMK